MKFHLQNCEYLLGKGYLHIIEEIKSHVKDHPDLIDNPISSGKSIDFVMCEGKVFSAKVVKEPGSSRLRVFSVKSKKSELRVTDMLFRVDVPLKLLTQDVGDAEDKYLVYQIRFATDRVSSGFTDDVVAPYLRGYVGITKRHFFTRWNEHISDMKSGKGHLLHKAWRFLIHKQIPFYPVFQICGVGMTLNQAYDAEEQLVGVNTLSPLGFNVIPGGLAGIKMLHELAVLKNNGSFPSVEDRDEAINVAFKDRKASRTHMRCKHIREYAKDKFTWVRECWVNKDV